MDLSFIIVSHNSNNYINKCVLSIKKNCLLSYEIIIVQNDNLPKNYLDDYKFTKIIELTENRGFGNACNAGAKNASGKFLFFINPDAEIITNNLEIIPSIFSDKSVGAIATKIVGEDGLPEKWSSGEKFSIWQIVKNKIGLSKKTWESTKRIPVGWASACSVIIKKDIFDAVGGFDERFFLYFEDVDICSRIRKIGKKIILIPEIKTLHKGGSSHKNRSSIKNAYYASQELYFKKYSGKISLLIIKLLRHFCF